MKNLIFKVSVLVIIVIIASCDSSNQIECIRASSNSITEDRDVKDYKGVALNVVGDLLLTQGPEYAFRIQGPDNVVALTTSKVENGVLVIGSESCFNGSYNLTIEITAPDFELISLSGIGKIVHRS